MDIKTPEELRKVLADEKLEPIIELHHSFRFGRGIGDVDPDLLSTLLDAADERDRLREALRGVRKETRDPELANRIGDILRGFTGEALATTGGNDERPQ